MYEQLSHARLNQILAELGAVAEGDDLRPFLTRLGANFHAIHSLFAHLWAEHPARDAMERRLVRVMLEAFRARAPELRALDDRREGDPDWFLDQRWAGMALYTDSFAGDLTGLAERLPYLQELGVNLLHLMPMLRGPAGARDGGYAVSDFRAIDERYGTLEQLRDLARRLRRREVLLVLDVVLNHTSDQHHWAQAAREGSERHRAYYHVFDDREVPDIFEETMPEVFPETAPGNFTYDEQMQKWVMTVFNTYQWDLDYSNPEVFVEMLDVVLHWANEGADVLRLDAVAFLWKKLGTTCQNLREAHLVLQLMKDCCQVTVPGVLLIAEAIVAPSEIAKYFGEDAAVARECDIAYNATFMALLWDAVATGNAKLLDRGTRSLPAKLDGATWLNYVRCHDDIGLGFDDDDVRAAGYEPGPHRRFLIDWYTGAYEASPARGLPFGRNDKTGDARISGSLASLAGLQSALEAGDPERVDLAVATMLLLHAMTMSLGGIPLLYYGDELGTLNDETYLDDADKAGDSRWAHRPRIDWSAAERRHEAGTVEQRLFDGLRRMIEVRRATRAFADFNNRDVLDAANDHVFAFRRTHPERPRESVLVVANFATSPQSFPLGGLLRPGALETGGLVDLLSGERVLPAGDSLTLTPRGFLWLADAHEPRV